MTSSISLLLATHLLCLHFGEHSLTQINHLGNVDNLEEAPILGHVPLFITLDQSLNALTYEFCAQMGQFYDLLPGFQYRLPVRFIETCALFQNDYLASLALQSACELIDEYFLNLKLYEGNNAGRQYLDWTDGRVQKALRKLLSNRKVKQQIETEMVPIPPNLRPAFQQKQNLSLVTLRDTFARLLERFDTSGFTAQELTQARAIYLLVCWPPLFQRLMEDIGIASEASPVNIIWDQVKGPVPLDVLPKNERVAAGVKCKKASGCIGWSKRKWSKVPCCSKAALYTVGGLAVFHSGKTLYQALFPETDQQGENLAIRKEDTKPLNGSLSKQETEIDREDYEETENEGTKEGDSKHQWILPCCIVLISTLLACLSIYSCLWAWQEKQNPQFSDNSEDSNEPL